MAPDLLEGEKRDRNHKILKEAGEKAKIHHEDEDEVRSLLQEVIFSTMKEPKISGNISVTDGSETQGSNTKENVISGHEIEKYRAAAVQRERSEQEKNDFHQTVEETASEKIKGINKGSEEHKETTIKRKTYKTQQVHAEAEKKPDISRQGVKDKPTFSFELMSVKNIKPLENEELKQTHKNTKRVEAENVETKKTHEIFFLEKKSQKERSPKHSPTKYDEAEEESYAAEGIQSKSERRAKPKSAKQKTLPTKQARQQIISQSLQLRDSQSKENTWAETEEKHIENISHLPENKKEGLRLAMSKSIAKSEIPQDEAIPLKKKGLQQIKQIPHDEGITDDDLIMKNEGRDLGKMSAPDEFLHETIQSKVVPLKDKLVKVIPIEGRTEMEPKRNILSPESEEETLTDNILQKPEFKPQSRTSKDGISQNMRHQTLGASKEEDIVKVGNIHCPRPIQSKGMEQMIKKTNSSELGTPTCQTEEGEMLAKTEQIVGKRVESESQRSKKISKTEKGERGHLLEIPQTERVPLKDKGQKVVRFEDTQLKIHSEVREVESDNNISAEEQKTKNMNIFIKSSTGDKENSETQHQAETQKQGKQQPLKGKAQDVQSKIIRTKDETAEVNSSKVNNAKKQELIKIMPALIPVIELTRKESLMAEDSSEGCASISEAGQDIVENRRLDVMSAKIKQPLEKKLDMSSETGENKISKQEQAKRKATCTYKPVCKASQSERLELPRPSASTGKSVDSKMITNKYTEGTDRLDSRDMQALSGTDEVILKDMITDKVTTMTVTDIPAKIISSEASQECIEADLREQEQPERKASAADLTQVTSKESLTRKLQMEAKPKEAESVQTESESASPREPQQNEIIVEQDQLNVSTVKDKTSKVIPNEERKTTWKQIERQVSVERMVEEITKKMEVASKDIAQIKETIFSSAEQDFGVTVGSIANESMSLKVTQQTLTKTPEAEDQPTPSQLKVNPLEYWKPKTHEQPIKREVSAATDKGIPQSDPSKEEKSMTNTLHRKVSLGVDAPKITGLRDAVSESLSDRDYHRKYDAQEGRRRTSDISKNISTQDARMVSDEKCNNTAPSEATKIRQEQIKGMTSVVPVMDMAAEQTPATTIKVTKDILQQTITSDQKEKDKKVEGSQSNLDTDKSKGGKVASIKKKILKTGQKIDSTVLGASEGDVADKPCLAKHDSAEKIDETAKPVKPEKKEIRWQHTTAEVTSEVKVKETKAGKVHKKKDVAHKLSKTAAEVINETGKIPPSVAAKTTKQEQTNMVTISHDKPFNEQTTKETQSKTVTVKTEYGSVTAFKVPETKEVQVRRKSSVPPVTDVASEKTQVAKDGELITDTCKYITAKTTVKDKPEKPEAKTEVSRAVQHNLTLEMEVASERSQIVGNVNSDTLKHPVTPDELIKDTSSRKECLIKMDTGVLAVEQDESKLDKAQDETKVSPISEELHERWKQTEGKASVACEALEKPSVMDTPPICASPEDVKRRPKQIKANSDVIPKSGEETTENKDIQSKKSKLLKNKGQFSVEEVQSMVAVKDVYESVSPLKVPKTKQGHFERTNSAQPVMTVASEKHLIVKDGHSKSDTLQRVFIPDKNVKDMTSRNVDVYQSSEVPLKRHLQSPLSAQDRLEILAVKHDITDNDSPTKEVTEQIASMKQKAEWNSVTCQKTPETLVGHDKYEVKYKRTSQNKSHSLKDQHQVTVEGIQSKTDTIRDGTPAVETKNGQTEIQKESLGRDKSDVAAEEIQSKVVTVKEKTGAVSPIEGAPMRLEHTESKATEETSKLSPVSDDRLEKCTTKDIPKDIIKSKEEIRTGFSAEQETKDQEQWPKSMSADDVAARVPPGEPTIVVQEQAERRPTVTWVAEESIIEDDNLGLQMKLAKVKETKQEKMIRKVTVKECRANQKTELEATGEQIKCEMLVTATEGNEEMSQFQQIISEETHISDKYKPSMLESKADIDVLRLYEPTVKEPSVTDKIKESIPEKETTDYKRDSSGYREGATRRWKPEVEQSCMEADVRYMPPREGGTITRKVKGTQDIQSIIETGVFSLEPEGKANVSLQQSSRGI